MDVGALAADAGDNPVAQLLVMASIIAGIAAWLGRRESGALALFKGIDEQRVAEIKRLEQQRDEAWQARDAARTDADRARLDAAEARAAEARAQEEAEMARDAQRRAETLLAEEVLRRSTAEHIAKEVEAMRGIRHRRAADGGEL